MFFLFQSDYFGLVTHAVAIVCLFIAFAGFGIEMENLANGRDASLTGYKKGTEIFINLGIGLALFILWLSLYQLNVGLILNIAISPVLMFGVYGMCLGIVNTLFTLLPNEVKNIKRSDLTQTEPSSTKRPFNTQGSATKIVAFIVGTTTFFAALLQILQILKVIP